MPNRKFEVGETCRLNKALPQSVKDTGVKAGMYGKIAEVKYDESAQHTMYTVQVGSRKIVSRSNALSPR